MPRIEFTIEPFVEGQPGLHVTAPVEALRGLGIEVEVGPFGSACSVTAGRAHDVVSLVVATALDHGASHVNIDVAADSAADLDGGDAP
ncbi:MAG TPA: hypothetical protein VIS05_04840 [Ilumatobacter sp.]